MKNFKRIASLVLALTMILCMGVTAFAYKITITDPDVIGTNGTDDRDGYVYEAYQIFAATYTSDDNDTPDDTGDDTETLSDITWGEAIVNKVYTTGNDGKEVEDATQSYNYVNELIAKLTDENADAAFTKSLVDAEGKKRFDTEGKEITGNIFSDVLKDITDDNDKANAVAEALMTYASTATDSDVAKAFADVVGDLINSINKDNTKVKITPTATCDQDDTYDNAVLNVGDKAGYYLVQNTAVPASTNVDGGLGEGSYTRYILQVVADTTIQHKGNVPTLTKTITADNNEEDTDIADDNKSNNLSVGSRVQYTLTGTIPAEAADYDYYYYIINDELSEGLTYVNETTTEGVDNTLKVTIDNVPLQEYDADKKEGDYVLTVTGNTLKIALLDAKSHNGESVVVTYWAQLNENAVIGDIEGNSNTADVTYSNDPNFDYDGTDDNHDGEPDSGKDVPTGETPDSTVNTYSTGIKIIKVDENGSPLTGAQFEITGKNVVKVIIVEEEKFVEDAENGKYYKLTNGSYTTEPPVEADYYAPAAEGATAGYVNVGSDETPVWEAYDKDEPNHVGKEIFILVKSNIDEYVADGKMYSKTTTARPETVGDNVNGKAYVDENGILTFTGLGEGEYTITETVTPAGYNSIDPITVTIDWEAPAEGSSECTWTAATDTALTLNDDGVFELEIVNNSGSTLPETGGIGTTIFYIAGGVLLVGAAVLLITKRRMNING